LVSDLQATMGSGGATMVDVADVKRNRASAADAKAEPSLLLAKLAHEGRR
jgi:hypothetical protein